MSSMIIRRPDGLRTFHRCGCDFPFKKFEVGMEPCNEVITEYNSHQCAIDAGWKYTDHIMFCPPDKLGAWVCPECAKGFKWEVRTIPARTRLNNLLYKQRRRYCE